MALVAIEEIYYTGTNLSAWDAFVSNDDIKDAVSRLPESVKVYCFSKFEPTTDGQFWHYEDGVVVKWQNWNEE